MSKKNESAHAIGAVERDTGISRDTLRVWERRYGFPQPERTAAGERQYPESQVRQLRLIRRLLSYGLRPGQVVQLDREELETLLDQLSEVPDTAALGASTRELLEAVLHHDAAALDKGFQQLLALQGLRRFVLSTVVPLVRTVGEQWEAGRMQVFEEHFLTRLLSRFLDTALSRIAAPDGRPTIMLATLPGEQHGIGLLMLEAILLSRGLSAYNLGTEVPMDQLVKAAEDYGVEVVALSFSGAYPYRMMRSHLAELAESLPDGISVWVGGVGAEQMRRMPNRKIERKSLEEI